MTKIMSLTALLSAQMCLSNMGMSGSWWYISCDLGFWLTVFYPKYDWAQLTLKGRVILLGAIASCASKMAANYLPSLGTLFDGLDLSALLCILVAYVRLGGGLNDDDDDDDDDDEGGRRLQKGPRPSNTNRRYQFSVRSRETMQLK